MADSVFGGSEVRSANSRFADTKLRRLAALHCIEHVPRVGRAALIVRIELGRLQSWLGVAEHPRLS